MFLIDELRAGANGVMTGFAMPEHLVSVVSAAVARTRGALVAPAVPDGGGE